ncbi:MAG: hypothetical protein IT340_22520 [Chloroflexi bacterium]|nr:hypothetical protein [Chloroflexota bacterium]
MAAEAAFRDALAGLEPAWRRLAGDRATARLREMMATLGAVRMAVRLLAGDLGWEGFTALSLAGRLDLGVEAQVLRPEFAGLFDETDRRWARARLAQFGYAAPWEVPADSV